MDSMEVIKGVAALLVARTIFFVTGTIGDILVKSRKLRETAIKIDPPPSAVPGAALAALAPIGPLLVSSAVANGETSAKRQCAACDAFNEGGKNGLGPNLYGVVARAHAGTEEFNFSNALKGKLSEWSFEDLNVWLHRADVIAFLRSLSKSPVPLPW